MGVRVLGNLTINKIYFEKVQSPYGLLGRIKVDNEIRLKYVIEPSAKNKLCEGWMKPSLIRGCIRDNTLDNLANTTK